MSDLRTPAVEALLNVFVGVQDNDTAFALLEDLFTIREIKETSQRLSVARMLDSGKPYVAIEEATGASATTIARVSKALNYGSGGYRTALKILDEREAAASQGGADASADSGAAASGGTEGETGKENQTA